MVSHIYRSPLFLLGFLVPAWENHWDSTASSWFNAVQKPLECSSLMVGCAAFSDRVNIPIKVEFLRGRLGVLCIDRQSRDSGFREYTISTLWNHEMQSKMQLPWFICIWVGAVGAAHLAEQVVLPFRVLKKTQI